MGFLLICLGGCDTECFGVNACVWNGTVLVGHEKPASIACAAMTPGSLLQWVTYATCRGVWRAQVLFILYLCAGSANKKVPENQGALYQQAPARGDVENQMRK